MNRTSLLVLAGTLVLLSGAACSRKHAAIEASGTVEVREVDLASRIASRVVTLLTDEGKAVKKNQVLARLDDRLVAAQKETAQALFTQAEKNYLRSRNLFESKSLTQEQFDAVRAQYTKARADLAQANIMLDEAEIRAPWDGVILRKNVEEGELVSVNTPLFTLGDLTRAKVRIYVPLVDLGRVRLNQEAHVSVDSFPGRDFPGTVTFISSEAEFTPKNIQTRDERVKEVFAVEVTVPNPDHGLKPGMPADVVLPVTDK